MSAILQSQGGRHRHHSNLHALRAHRGETSRPRQVGASRRTDRDWKEKGQRGCVRAIAPRLRCAQPDRTSFNQFSHSHPKACVVSRLTNGFDETPSLRGRAESDDVDGLIRRHDEQLVAVGTEAQGGNGMQEIERMRFSACRGFRRARVCQGGSRRTIYPPAVTGSAGVRKRVRSDVPSPVSRREPARGYRRPRRCGRRSRRPE